MTPVQSLLLAAFAVSTVFGAAAQSSRFCPQGGLRDALYGGQPARLLTYFAAIGFALLGMAGLQLLLQQPIVPARPPYLSANLPWGRYVVGGFLFGAGMVLARGCPLRMTVRVAQGSPAALLLLVTMAAAAYAFSRTELFDLWVAPWLGPTTIDLRAAGLSSQGLDAIAGVSGRAGRVALGALLGAGILLLVARRLPWRRNAISWVAASVLGLMISAGYWLTSGSIGQAASDEASFMAQPIEGMGVQSLTYAGPLSDVVHFALRPGQQTFSIGVVLMLGTLAGALVSALLRREFKPQGIGTPGALGRQLAGAAMTGAGAVIGLGCTVGHGLSGVSVLSLGSLIGVVSIFAGAMSVLWIAAALPSAARDSTASA